jgi:NmrA-like family
MGADHDIINCLKELIQVAEWCPIDARNTLYWVHLHLHIPLILHMVAVSPPAKVLVSGANGYLATWVVKKALEAQYSVRATVRSLTKSAFLKDKFAHYGDRFELVVVEDITKDGAFDEAIRGVDVVLHTASPFHFKATEPDGASFFPPNARPFDEHDVFRAHHPCRARNHIDLEFCSETWQYREAFCPHLFGRRSPRNFHATAHLYRRKLE